MEQINNSAIQEREAIIERGATTFKIPIKQIIMSAACFICKKCGHKWLPKDRMFNTIPLHCPKCYDKYWFLSHEEIKNIKKEVNTQDSPNERVW